MLIREDDADGFDPVSGDFVNDLRRAGQCFVIVDILRGEGAASDLIFDPARHLDSCIPGAIRTAAHVRLMAGFLPGLRIGNRVIGQRAGDVGCVGPQHG